MSRYIPLRVHHIQPETAECVSLWLEVPDNLKDTFTFLPGQHLHFRAHIDGVELRKSYSICSVPGDPHLVVAVKRVYDGRFSTYANVHLRPGETLEVTPPEGKFVLPENLPADAVLLFFAAGSGITPVVSMIDYFLANWPEGQVILFYSNKTSDSIIFRDRLEAMKNQNMTRFSIYHVLTKEVSGIELLSGRIDKEKCKVFAKHFFDPSEIHTCFICGPELMIHDVSDAMKEMGLKENQIRFELFGTAPAHVRTRQEMKPVMQGEDKAAKVTVRIDGHETNLNMTYHGKPVLDVALESGIDIPFSCKGGVCSTCRALVVEGDIYMDIHYGLEPDEIDAGYVLTCQSHPRSEKLILDYDIL